MITVACRSDESIKRHFAKKFARTEGVDPLSRRLYVNFPFSDIVHNVAGHALFKNGLSQEMINCGRYY